MTHNFNYRSLTFSGVEGAKNGFKFPFLSISMLLVIVRKKVLYQFKYLLMLEHIVFLSSLLWVWYEVRELLFYLICVLTVSPQFYSLSNMATLFLFLDKNLMNDICNADSHNNVLNLASHSAATWIINVEPFHIFKDMNSFCTSIHALSRFMYALSLCFCYISSLEFLSSFHHLIDILDLRLFYLMCSPFWL